MVLFFGLIFSVALLPGNFSADAHVHLHPNKMRLVTFYFYRA